MKKIFYGMKKEYIYTNDGVWDIYDNDHGHVVKKKREFLIQEALHKTYKWREDFNTFLKLLQSSKR